jgi:zinc transporter ZupT
LALPFTSTFEVDMFFQTMPELAFAYTVGFLLTWICVGVVMVLNRHRPWPERRSHIILGAICAFASWIGLVFFIVVEVSFVFLAKRSR